MRGQRGQTAVEYIGALLVVATLVGAVATSHAGASIRHALADKVCAIARGENGCGGAPERAASGRHLLATTASVHRSYGARRVAAANRAATRAIVKALLHPWGQPLKDADAAIRAFKQQLAYCTNNDRRPPNIGCPGIKSADTSVEKLLGLYDAVHAVHDTLAKLWSWLTTVPQHKPTQKEIDAAVAQFVVDAAVGDGAKTDKDVEEFVKAHRNDINEGLRSVSARETNWTGGQYIARGARDPDLRNAIKQLYRPGAKVGDGGTADILVKEAEAGCRQGACTHFEKAVGYRRNLQSILSKTSLTGDDRKIAGELIGKLNKAIQRAGGE